MTSKEEEFLQALRATFKVEAVEHLQAIGTGLLELEKAATPETQRPLVEVIFRAAHSLKGAARAVNFSEIESICQSLEEAFSSWKRGASEPDATALDTAHRALDAMSAALEKPAPQGQASARNGPPVKILPAGRFGQTIATSLSTDALIQQGAPSGSRTSLSGTGPQTGPAVSAGGGPSTHDTETVRIALHSLDARLLEAEELLSAKLAAEQRTQDLDSLAARFEEWRKEWAKAQPQARALRQTIERSGAMPTAAAAGGGFAALTEFLDWNQDYVRALEGKVTALRRTAEQDRLLVGRLVDDLLENSKKLLMLPLATLGTLLPKLVRDLSRDQGKDVDLVIRGEEVKIDKRILEEMKDPLIHLLRNSVDHGIETPEQRRRAGKPPRATIMLEVAPVNGHQVELTVSDDGAGIDVDRVKAAALKRGLLTPDSAARVDDALATTLVFEADLSTSPIITQVSGRGLGLAIVREKVEKLGGRITIESRRGVGTTFRMMLPLTLATFRGVLVEAAKRLFVVPTAQVERVTRFKPEDIQTVKGRETLVLNGRTVSLVRLAQVLDLPPVQRSAEQPASAPVLILGAGEQRVAFAIDAVLDEREVLIKRLNKPLSRLRNIAGATILGSGEVAPVLNVADLLKSAKTAGAPLHSEAPIQALQTEAKSILVAEDSITSRMLIKGILESAGYRVTTAVDGMDAFTTLRAGGRFDAVVSDVEMPRLSGFDLTARIRADRTLKEMPVVLVTALESREDRERGIDVGANAYLVKSDLDQSNLLEALRRLA